MEEKELIKELVDNGIYCLKIENEKGEELEGVYLTKDYSSFIKVSKYSGEQKNTYLDKFIKLLER